MIALERSREWWRPADVPVSAAPGADSAPSTQVNPWAFRAMLFFIIVNIGAPQDYFPVLGPMRLALLSALAAVGLYLFSADKTLKSRPMPTEMKVLLGIFALATLTVPFSVWPGGSAAFLIEFLKTLTFFWLLSRVIVRPGQILTVFWVFSWLAVPLALTGVKAYLAGEFTQGRIEGHGGLASNPNDLALTLDLILPMAAVAGITAKKRLLRLAAVAIIGISLGCIVMTFSRAGFLGLIVMTGSTLFLSVRRGNAKPIGLAVVIVIVALACLPSSYYGRLSTIANPDADETGSAQGRLVGMVGAIDYISKHPIVGAGVGMDAIVLNDYGAHWFHVHTAYLMYGVDLGLPGMALYIALMMCAYWKARKVEREAYAERAHELSLTASALKISLLGFAVIAIFAPVAYCTYFYYLAGLVVALHYCHRPIVALKPANV